MTGPLDNHHQNASPTPEAGYPIAHPIASAASAASPLVDATSAPSGETNDGAHTGTTHRHQRPSRIMSADIPKIASRLSERDMAIIRSIDDHRLLTQRHVEALHFAGHAPTSGTRIAHRTLTRLGELRIVGTLDRRIGGVHAGSHGFVYHLDVIGDRVLHARRGRDTRRRREPTERFLRHTLTIADAHVDLITAHRQGTIELIDSAVEPATWRRFTGLGSARRTLKPDLFIETADADDLVRAWFIEIDRGTESIPTLLTKCREYETYRQSGIEQDQHGSFPLVVWSITHADPAKAAHRRQALTEAISADPRLPSALFRIVASEGVLPLIQNRGEQ